MKDLFIVRIIFRICSTFTGLPSVVLQNDLNVTAQYANYTKGVYLIEVVTSELGHNEVYVKMYRLMMEFLIFKGKLKVSISGKVSKCWSKNLRVG